MSRTARCAVRRAVLTIGLDLAQCCDDSYGALGDVIGLALEAYTGTDWRAAGVASEVFWPDYLETLHAHAVVATGALDRFEATARRAQVEASHRQLFCGRVPAASGYAGP